MASKRIQSQMFVELIVNEWAKKRTCEKKMHLRFLYAIKKTFISFFFLSFHVPNISSRICKRKVLSTPMTLFNPRLSLTSSGDNASSALACARVCVSAYIYAQHIHVLTSTRPSLHDNLCNVIIVGYVSGDVSSS